MGLYVSKPDSSHAATVKKRQPCDDGHSSATVTTEDSSVRVLTARSRSGATSDPKGSPPNRSTSRLNQQTWRSGSAPSFSRAPGRRSSGSMENSAMRSLQRCDSDPGTPNERRSSAPMKCPPRHRNTVAGHNSGTTTHASSPLGEDPNYLMKMYDTRTWEMYSRITEARKNSSYASSNAANAQNDHATAGESTSGWENLQHDDSDCQGGMVFLFDFD
jgi:hypothetical protein